MRRGLKIYDYVKFVTLDFSLASKHCLNFANQLFVGTKHSVTLLIFL